MEQKRQLCALDGNPVAVREREAGPPDRRGHSNRPRFLRGLSTRILGRFARPPATAPGRRRAGGSADHLSRTTDPSRRAEPGCLSVAGRFAIEPERRRHRRRNPASRSENRSPRARFTRQHRFSDRCGTAREYHHPPQDDRRFGQGARAKCVHCRLLEQRPIRPNCATGEHPLGRRREIPVATTVGDTRVRSAAHPA